MNTQRVSRSRSDRLIAGVASGLAHYFQIDPILVRIIFVVLAMMFNVVGVVAYLALWVLLPNEDSTAVDISGQVRENVAEIQGAAEGIVARVRGMFARS